MSWVQLSRRVRRGEAGRLPGQRQATAGLTGFNPDDRLLHLQHSIGNQAVAQLLRTVAEGRDVHAPMSVMRMALVQRCGPTPCNCSAEERARKESRAAAKPRFPQCGVSSPDEMGSDAVAQIANATDSDDENSPGKQARATIALPEPHIGQDALHGFRRPMAGAATIVCDGKGGYRVALNDWAGAPCGTESCVVKHESQHIKDWKKRWPNGCKPKADHPDGSDIPLGGDGYDAFLNDSECKAHTVDLKCADTLLKTAKGDCKAKVKAYRDLTAEQKKNYC